MLLPRKIPQFKGIFHKIVDRLYTELFFMIFYNMRNNPSARIMRFFSETSQLFSRKMTEITIFPGKFPDGFGNVTLKKPNL